MGSNALWEYRFLVHNAPHNASFRECSQSVGSVISADPTIANHSLLSQVGYSKPLDTSSLLPFLLYTIMSDLLEFVKLFLGQFEPPWAVVFHLVTSDYALLAPVEDRMRINIQDSGKLSGGIASIGSGAIVFQ